MSRAATVIGMIGADAYGTVDALGRARTQGLCWTEGFTAEKCCNMAAGPQGDLSCWDELFSFSSCCKGSDNSSVLAESARSWRRVHVNANRSTRGSWALFADHRANVTTLLMKLMKSGHKTGSPIRLAILGSGNLNDIDVQRLSGHSQNLQILTIDLDTMASRSAASRQKGQENSTVSWSFVDADLTGVLARLESVGAGGLDAASEQTVEDIARAAQAHRISGTIARGGAHKTFDVVLSAAVLSQMCRHLNLLIRSPARFTTMCSAVAEAHLQSMVDMLSPGGVGVVVSEVCDTERCTCLDDTFGNVHPSITCLERSRDALLFDVLSLPHLLRSPGFQASGISPTSVRLHEPWLWTQPEPKPKYFAIATSFQATKIISFM